MAGLWERIRSPYGGLTLLCTLFSIVGCWLIGETPAALFGFPHYTTFILMMVALLNLMAVVVGQPLLWVIAAGFMLIVVDPAIVVLTNKGVAGLHRFGYILALGADLFSFIFSNPSIPDATNTNHVDHGLDKFIGLVAFFTLIGEILIWTRGVVSAQALWLILVYVSCILTGFVHGRSFVVFASTVFAPRLLMISLQTTGLLQIGMMVCAGTLGAVVLHFLYRCWLVDGTEALGWSFWDLRTYFENFNNLARLIFFVLGLSGSVMIWVAAGDRTPEVISSIVLFLATILNHVAPDMKFHRLNITAITLIYSVLDSSAALAHQSTITNDDVQLTGWILLFMGCMGSTIMGLPIKLHELPYARQRPLIISSIQGIALIAGCIAVWADRHVYNNVLSLGFLGLVMIFAGSFCYVEGVETVFHAAILLVATFTPADFLYFPWVALVMVLVAFVSNPRTNAYDEVIPSGGGPGVVADSTGATTAATGAPNTAYYGGIWNPSV